MIVVVYSERSVGPQVETVVALLSRSAAEPPTLADVIAAKAAEIDAAGLGYVDPIHTHARCRCTHTLAEHTYQVTEDGRMVCNVGDCDCTSWDSVGVAAEPNKETGDAD